jgi:hypothetical protein
MNKKFIISAGDRQLDDEEQYFKLYKKKGFVGFPNRWNNYLGVPKHLIPIKGEPLIHRTQRLLLENGASDIWVSCNKQNFEKYVIDGCNPIETHFDRDSLYPDHEFLSTLNMENKNGITVQLFADIYYTEELIKELINNPSEDWHYYARRISSQITGKLYGEMFAWYYRHDHIEKLIECGTIASQLTSKYVKDYEEGKTTYPWIMEESSKMTYRIMAGLNTEDPHAVENVHWIEWNDESEDFDYPIDWDNWSKRLPHLAY